MVQLCHYGPDASPAIRDHGEMDMVNRQLPLTLPPSSITLIRVSGS